MENAYDAGIFCWQPPRTHSLTIDSGFVAITVDYIDTEYPDAETARNFHSCPLFVDCEHFHRCATRKSAEHIGIRTVVVIYAGPGSINAGSREVIGY
jgi:hypothetical protein